MYMYMYIDIYMYMYTYIQGNWQEVFYLANIQQQCFDKLIWCTIGPKSFLFGLHSSLFGRDGAVNYDYIATNSINNYC